MLPKASIEHIVAKQRKALYDMPAGHPREISGSLPYLSDRPLLIGGILAAQAIMPTTGLFIIVAFWCINKCSKKPLVSMAVGPLGAILVGLIANVLFLLSLYTPAA